MVVIAPGLISREVDTAGRPGAFGQDAGAGHHILSSLDIRPEGRGVCNRGEAHGSSCHPAPGLRADLALLFNIPMPGGVCSEVS